MSGEMQRRAEIDEDNMVDGGPPEVSESPDQHRLALASEIDRLRKELGALESAGQSNAWQALPVGSGGD